MKSTREKILDFIKQNNGVGPTEISDFFLLNRAMVHRHLKKLMEEDKIKKIGNPPKVKYFIKEKYLINYDFKDDEVEILNKNFLYITPTGEKMSGVEAFIKWYKERKMDPEKALEQYIKILEKYSKMKKEGFYDATHKIKNSFDKVCADKILYIDFNSVEIFGKTKLGQMVLYAKQGQNRKEMLEISSEIKSKIENLIKKENIDSVVFVPPTVKREYQFMKFIEKGLDLKLPKIIVKKINNEVVVPQKTLKKLSDRQENAKATFEVVDNGHFQKTLIIDDAVGSGATINEIACKLKNKEITKEIIGISIVGSLNGFEVISEV